MNVSCDSFLFRDESTSLFPPCSTGNTEDESRTEIRCFGGNEQEERISNKHLYCYGNTKDNVRYWQLAAIQLVFCLCQFQTRDSISYGSKTFKCACRLEVWTRVRVPTQGWRESKAPVSNMYSLIFPSCQYSLDNTLQQPFACRVYYVGLIWEITQKWLKTQRRIYHNTCIHDAILYKGLKTSAVFGMGKTLGNQAHKNINGGPCMHFTSNEKVRIAGKYCSKYLQQFGISASGGYSQAGGGIWRHKILVSCDKLCNIWCYNLFA